MDVIQIHPTAEEKKVRRSPYVYVVPIGTTQRPGDFARAVQR